MSKGLYLTAFAAGVITGAAVSWGYLKQKYEKIAQEEIDSVKEVFSKNEQEDTGRTKEQEYSEKMAEQAREKADVTEYAAILQRTGYADVSEKEDVTVGKDGPYVITPDEFGELDEYEQVNYIYYADGVLANEEDEIIEDVEAAIGDALEHFGEYEEDAVFARNEERGCDYEILRDKRNFSEVTGRAPHPLEVE